MATDSPERTRQSSSQRAHDEVQQRRQQLHVAVAKQTSEDLNAWAAKAKQKTRAAHPPDALEGFLQAGITTMEALHAEADQAAREKNPHGYRCKPYFSDLQLSTLLERIG